MQNSSVWILILLTLLLCFHINLCDYKFESKCEIGSFSSCRNMTRINGTKITCQICNLSNSPHSMTVCYGSNEVNATKNILNYVHESTKYLHIDLTTVWFGGLSYSKKPICLSGISRLKNLKKFHLISSSPYLQSYLLRFNLSDFDNLKMLNTLRIRVPFLDGDGSPNISEIIDKLPQLELLDFSDTTTLGIESVIGILKKLNNTNITSLCMKNFQGLASKEYRNDLGSYLWRNNDLKLTYPFLQELDMSNNDITRLTPGFIKIFPNLTAIDVSRNLLVDGRNAAWILELILHPTLERLNGNFQGCQTQITDDKFKRIIPDNHVDILPLKDIFDCINDAGKGNISDSFRDKFASCQIMKCVIPNFLEDVSCTNSTYIPELSLIYNYSCMLYMNFPVGNNLKSIKFSDIRLNQVGAIGSTLSGKFCIWKTNTLERFEMNNNAWMEHFQIDNEFSKFSGSWNLNSLKTLLFSNNRVNIDFSDELTNILPSLKYLNLSGNNINFKNYCKHAPNTERLDIQNSNIIDFQSNVIEECLKLKEIYLSNNKNLNISSLGNLNFSKNHNLTYIGLRNINLQYLPDKFLQQMDRYKNLTIDLSSNPLTCNCNPESKQFLLWMKERPHSLVNFNSYFCFGPQGLRHVSDVNDTTIFWGSCPDKYLRLAFIIAICTVVIFIVSSVSLLIYKLRWRLRYIFFKLKLNCYSYFKKSNGKKYIWRYDAFVSYCAEDRFWVHDTFMKILEETYGFHLCIHYRDFPVGGDIAETISERMSESRELIIILSDIAIKSEWCQFELDEALLHAHRRNKQLIVIKLGKIKDNLLNKKIAHVLDNHTFLEWSDNSECNRNELFWKKLIAQLFDKPYGEINCCCSFGPRSLGYRDFINPLDDDPDSQLYEDPEDVPEHIPARAQKYRKRARSLRKRANQARNFKRTLENDLEDVEELPHWAYGPIPWPIEELLKEDKPKFEDQTFKHADERIRLLIDCLAKKHAVLNELYQKEMEVYEKMRH